MRIITDRKGLSCSNVIGFFLQWLPRACLWLSRYCSELDILCSAYPVVSVKMSLLTSVAKKRWKKSIGSVLVIVTFIPVVAVKVCSKNIFKFTLVIYSFVVSDIYQSQ